MASKNVEMTPAESAAPTASAQEPPKEDAVLSEIKNNAALIERAVSTIEGRFTSRVLRTLTGLRRRLNGEVLREAVSLASPSTQTALTPYLPSASTTSTSAMDVDTTTETPSKKTPAARDLSPEVDVYLRLLVILFLIDQKKLVAALDLSTATLQLVQAANRRTLDALAAKVWFYHYRAYELLGRELEVRTQLLAAQRTAVLRKDVDSQAVLLNLLLRSYLSTNSYDQADKLIAKTTFPEGAGNSQLARYLYYLGRVRAVQLNYTEAHQHLQQAIRRAPNVTVAPGFLQTVHKFFITVELLMGDIPERSIFRQEVLKNALEKGGYLSIVQAVRVGDLSLFQSALNEHAQSFLHDGTHTLILRLRHNVIKTGLRMLSLSYSRISLRDICAKLRLDSEEDAEYIVAKAIRDGVIDATLEHEKGYMQSSQQGNVYETDEPQSVFRQRVAFCLDLHNESVKSMRYPLKANATDLANMEEAREREARLARELEEGDLDGDEDMGDFDGL